MNTEHDQQPSYLQLFRSGELRRREEIFSMQAESCELCPNECHINRIKGEKGRCNGGSCAVVSSASPHFGEEDPLVGYCGSGTIFFCHCPLHCLFCQNYEISQLGEGQPVSDTQLSNLMLGLQERGCHNINLVTPTHYVPNIIRALVQAIPSGLHIPLVYNTGGYDSIGTLRLLNGVVDIYMPDFKYWDDETAYLYSGIRRYPEAARAAVTEMYRQVGDLKCNNDGVAFRGLLIRHLVLPHDIARSCEIMRFIAEKISTSTYVNIMAQYRPAFHAFHDQKLRRAVTPDEYDTVIRFARSIGLYRGF